MDDKELRLECLKIASLITPKHPSVEITSKELITISKSLEDYILSAGKK